MVEIPMLLKAIGAAYSGTVDLGICGTKPLAAFVRATCPAARWVLMRLEVRLDVRASILRATLRSLAGHPRPYQTAFADTVVEMSIEAHRRDRS